MRTDSEFPYLIIHEKEETAIVKFLAEKLEQGTKECNEQPLDTIIFGLQSKTQSL